MTRDMTTGSPIARILAFCGPLLLGNLFQQFYNLADSVIVGRILGVNAFAAVGSTAALNFLILGFALGICSGFAIPVSMSFGAGEMENVRTRTGQLIWLGLFFTALITAVTCFWTDDILRWNHTPAEIYDEAYRYIYIVFLGAGATILYNLCSAVLRALGDSRTPLLFLMAAVGINVALDLLFMRFLGMGVEGAACATVLSQLLSGLACLVYIRRCVPVLRLHRRHLRPQRKRLTFIASIGVPMGLQFSITAIGSILMQGAVNGLGTAAVAAVSAGTKVHNLVETPLNACGAAMATYCGQNLGAGDTRRIRGGIRAITPASFAYCVFGLLFNMFAGSAVAELFLDASETAILADVHSYLVTMGAAYPLLAVIYIFRNSLQGMGFSKPAMLAGVAELAARALAALVLVGPLGFRAVCLASPLAWLFADVLLLLLYRAEMRKLERRLPAPEPQRQERPRLRHAGAK